MKRSRKGQGGQGNRGGNEWSALKSPAGRQIQGVLNGNGVTVTREQDVKHLWFCGCYGKGVLSRSQAERLRSRGDRYGPSPTEENPFHGTASRNQLPALKPVLGVSNEPCHLTPEETVYLMQHEQCLTLVPPQSVAEVRAYFSARHARFQELYFAYQHYRGLGWIVRAGSKMGVDLVLYQDHPGREHALHSVLVQPESARLSWPELLGLGRVSESVRKTLLLCRVLLDEDGESGRVAQELVYTRWATNRTRNGAYGAEADNWSDD